MNIEQMEKIRNRFESWYCNQKLDQIATWHSVENLEYGQKKYPYGRYTIFSMKQTAWEIWLASYLDKDENL
jgi:hypothetical protein